MADLEAALGAAFGDPQPEPVETPAAEPETTEAPEVAETPAETPDEAVVEPEAPAEPEFEVEVDGARETVRGNDRVRELLQKGLHYTKNSEVNARVREQLVAQAKHQQVMMQFATSHMQDLAELQALDQALAQWARFDMGQAFESDPLNAMKLKEQRDQLKEQRAAKFQQITQKQAAFQQSQAQAAQQARSVEWNALVAKLPEWRNSEKAQAETQQLSSYLSKQGYSQQEIDQISDHRGVILLRKAMLYDQLQSGKAEKLKMARTAPPVAKPGTKGVPTSATALKGFKSELSKAVKSNNTRAQEDLMSAAFARAFK